SYFNAIFFKSLNVPEPRRLMKVYGTERRDSPVGLAVGHATYEAYRDRSQAFADLGMFWNGPSVPVRINGPRARPVDLVQPTFVTGSLFHAIGNSAAFGRGIEASDELTGAPHVVVLNDEAERQYFAGDPGSVGRTLFIDNVAYTVVGAMPPSF